MFNVEVTAYPGIAPPLYSHVWLVALVLSLGTLWEIALGGMPLSPSFRDLGLSRTGLSSTTPPGSFGPSSFIFGHFFVLDMGLGLDMKWARVVKFFGPTGTFQQSEPTTP